MTGLMPREHGAYAQLGFPLLTGLIYARGDAGAVAFAVAAVAIFLAHEPLAVRSGMRGRRLQDQLAEAAGRRILLLAAAALTAAIAGIGLAPPRAWIGAVLPGGMALLLLPLLGTRKMKSIPAEVIVAAIFSSSVVPLALTGPATLHSAAIAAAVWFGAVLPAIFAVHAVKAALKKRPEERWVLRAAPVVAGAVVLAAAAGATLLPDATPLLATLPPALVSLGVSLRPPHPRHLKRLGWSMVVADTATLVMLLVL